MDNTKMILKMFSDIILLFVLLVLFLLNTEDLITQLLTTSFIVFKIIDIEIALTIKNCKTIEIIQNVIETILKCGILINLIRLVS